MTVDMHTASHLVLNTVRDSVFVIDHSLERRKVFWHVIATWKQTKATRTPVSAMA